MIIAKLIKVNLIWEKHTAKASLNYDNVKCFDECSDVWYSKMWKITKMKYNDQEQQKQEWLFTKVEKL